MRKSERPSAADNTEIVRLDICFGYPGSNLRSSLCVCEFSNDYTISQLEVGEKNVIVIAINRSVYFQRCFVVLVLSLFVSVCFWRCFVVLVLSLFVVFND